MVYTAIALTFGFPVCFHVPCPKDDKIIVGTTFPLLNTECQVTFATSGIVVRNS